MPEARTGSPAVEAAARATAGFGLVRIEVRGFRSAREIAFAPAGVCALVGEANAGKSNILMAIRALLDSGAPPIVRGDLSLGGDGRITIRGVLASGETLGLEAVPDEVATGSLQPNLLFYGPRTAHGSSLSPGVHASLFARAGMLEEAVEALRLTSRVDLDDLTQTSAGGLHLATMGSLWQALAFGFAGVRPAGTTLRVDPHLPAGWGALGLRLRFQGSQVTVRLEPDSVFLQADPSVRFVVGARRSPILATPAGVRLGRHGRSWKEVQP